MAGTHAKPIATFNFKKIIIPILALAVLMLAGIGAWQMYFSEEESLPKGISGFNVDVSAVDIQSPGNPQGLSQAGSQEAGIIKDFMKGYLNNVFISKNAASPMAPKFLKANKNSLITTKGSAKLTDILIVYDKSKAPVMAITDLELSSKFYLPKKDDEAPNKQYEYVLKGEVIFKKVGAWSISNIQLDSNTKEFKVVEE